MNKAPKDVDSYISAAPKEVRAKLRELRAAIRAVARKAEERISYGMPYYGYKGRLAYFRLAKAHIGLYIPTPVIEEHKSELRDYETAKATVRFPIGKPLPVALIRKLVNARVAKNEGARKKEWNLPSKSRIWRARRDLNPGPLPKKASRPVSFRVASHGFNAYPEVKA